MRERLFEPGAFAAFYEGFTAVMELQRRERLAQNKRAQRDLMAVERRQSEILKTLADGYRSEAWKAELLTLDERKAALTGVLSEPQLPALHPNMAEVFRHKATMLAEGLEHEDHRDSAREALRGFVERIVIPPGDELLKVVGNLGAMLEAASGQKVPGRQAVGYVGCGGTQPTGFGVLVVGRLGEFPAVSSNSCPKGVLSGYLTPLESKALQRAGLNDGGHPPAEPARADQEEHENHLTDPNPTLAVSLRGTD